MFEKATRLKLRFYYNGVCTVEDLWDLSLQSLDSIFRDLNSEFDSLKGLSLLQEENPEEETLQLKLNIVKHIFSVKKSEQLEAAKAIDRAQRKQKLLSKIAEKQDAALDDMSIDDLMEEINKL